MDECEIHQVALLFPASTSDTRLSNAQQKVLSTDYQLLNKNHWRCYLRTPTAVFRPTQCNALHLDVWHGHNNIFVGTGSYSHNCEAKWLATFQIFVIKIPCNSTNKKKCQSYLAFYTAIG